MTNQDQLKADRELLKEWLKERIKKLVQSEHDTDTFWTVKVQSLLEAQKRVERQTVTDKILDIIDKAERFEDSDLQWIKSQILSNN